MGKIDKGRLGSCLCGEESKDNCMIQDNDNAKFLRKQSLQFLTIGPTTNLVEMYLDYLIIQ